MIRSTPLVLKPHFFGEAPERRPWAIKREDRPAAFAGRSFPPSVDFADWDTCYAYTGEYPIPPWHVCPTKYRTAEGVILRNSLEKIARTSGERIVKDYTEAL